MSFSTWLITTSYSSTTRSASVHDLPRAASEELRFSFELLADRRHVPAATVTDADEEVRADEQHHLTDLDHFLGVDVLDRLEDHEPAVAVALELRALMSVQGVLDGEWMQPELRGDLLELVLARLEQPGPHEAARVPVRRHEWPHVAAALPVFVQHPIHDHRHTIAHGEGGPFQDAAGG
jgi:hypothetical protein